MAEEWEQDELKLQVSKIQDKEQDYLAHTKGEDFFDLTFEARSGFTSNTIMFLTEHRIRFSIKSSWPVLPSMSVTEWIKNLHNLLYLSYTTHHHPNLEVSQSIQFRKTRFQPSLLWQPLSYLQSAAAVLAEGSCNSSKNGATQRLSSWKTVQQWHST